MSILDAVKKILMEVGHELTAKELAETLISDGLWQTNGKTPDATIGARIYVDMKRNPQTTPFIKCKRGYFGLKEYAAQKTLQTSTETTKAAQSEEKPSKPIASKSDKGLSFTEAALKVLEVFGKRKPMHYRDITERAIKEGWIVSSGKTPEASLYAQVITEIQRSQKRGNTQRFVQCGKGYIGLTQWEGNSLAFQIEQHNRTVSLELKKRLQAMKPGEFEELISQLLPRMGFVEVELTPLSKDGGIDVRGVMVTNNVIRTKMAVQVKRWKNNVQSPIVQQVRGSLGAHEQGLIITLGDFSKGAIEEASKVDKTPIALMNGDVLVSLLMEYEIGVKRINQSIFELEEMAL